MRLFADTANMDELKKMDAMGILEGITTNPTIASQAGKSLRDTLEKLSREFPDIEVFGPGSGKRYCGYGRGSKKN